MATLTMPLLSGAPTWEWAAQMAEYIGAVRKWPDAGSVIAEEIRTVYARKDAASPAAWDALADEVMQTVGVDPADFPGGEKLAKVYRSAGVTNGQYTADKDAQSYTTVVSGTVSGSLDDVASGVRTAEETATKTAKGLGALLSSPLGIVLGLAGLAAGAVAVKKVL